MNMPKGMLPVMAVCLLLGLPAAAHALKLEIRPEAPVALHALATILLYLHIGGGFVGLVAGFAASLSKKGGTLHR